MRHHQIENRLFVVYIDQCLYIHTYIHTSVVCTDASTVAAETKATTEANDVRQNDDEPKTELDLMLEGILAEEAS